MAEKEKDAKTGSAVAAAAAAAAGEKGLKRAPVRVQLNEVEAAFVSELTRLRAAPADYAAVLRAKRLGRYDANKCLNIGNIQFDTLEGEDAVHDAIKTLLASPPVPV
jgi:hypothetical protein